MKKGDQVQILNRSSVKNGVIITKLSKEIYQVGTDMGNLWAINKKDLRLL